MKNTDRPITRTRQLIGDLKQVWAARPTHGRRRVTVTTYIPGTGRRLAPVRIVMQQGPGASPLGAQLLDVRLADRGGTVPLLRETRNLIAVHRARDLVVFAITCASELLGNHAEELAAGVAAYARVGRDGEITAGPEIADACALAQQEGITSLLVGVGEVPLGTLRSVQLIPVSRPSDIVAAARRAAA